MPSSLISVNIKVYGIRTNTHGTCTGEKSLTYLYFMKSSSVFLFDVSPKVTYERPCSGPV